MPTLDLTALNEAFEEAHPREILAWAWSTFGARVGATSSFQTQSVPLLHLISLECPELPIFFLDTGFHFPETLAFRDDLKARLGLNIVDLHPLMGQEAFAVEHGQLHARNPDMCCYINKVEPLEAARAGLDAWITGIRRDQTAHRSATPIVSRGSDGRIKICPLATWDKRQVWRYLAEHALPEHPLTDLGYMSIGCAPCTRPVTVDGDDRSGRWAGQGKTECGLHFEAGAFKARAQRAAAQQGDEGDGGPDPAGGEPT